MFQFGGLGALLGGLRTRKILRGDGTGFRTGVIKTFSGHVPLQYFDR